MPLYHYHSEDACPSANAELQAQFDTMHAQLSEALTSLQQKQLPILDIQARINECAQLEVIAANIRAKAKQLVVIGTGGSSLGGKTLVALAESDFPVCFIENIDPHTIKKQLAQLPLAECFFLIISKSGGTVETVSQCLLMRQMIINQLGKAHWAAHAMVITMGTDSPLRTLAKADALHILDHHRDIGGRYAIFTNVALLPALIAGVDGQALLRGAASVLSDIEKNISQGKASPLAGAALQAAWMSHHPNTVLIPYCDRLESLSYWFKQLWAESLGKNGKGSTPLAALGTVDQHSQLQLWLDGPQDKSFTFIVHKADDKGPRIESTGMAALECYEGHAIGTMMAAMQHGTIRSLVSHGLPVRVFELENITTEAVGALLIHFILETMLVAELLGINAYDQPAVEEGKLYAREYLKRKAPEGSAA